MNASLIAVIALLAHPTGAGSPGDPVDRPPVDFAPVRVVASLPIYGSIVEEIGGSEVQIVSIADPNEDAHFVRPKPSFALELRRADLFVTTGLDLELWVPTLLDRAGNGEVMEGGTGYVTAYTGVTLLDVPVAADRSQGDVHLYGNPHLHTDPLRTLQIARNLTVGLERVAPERASLWRRGLEQFQDRIYRATFGDALVELLGGETLEQISLAGNLHSFLQEQEYEGHALIQDLGGWLGDLSEFRGRDMICYHKNWAYLEDRFGLTCAEYVEAKSGISPTPRHVARLIELMQDQGIRVLLAANYFDRTRVETVAERGGAAPVIVPLYPDADATVPDYFTLVDRWVQALRRALAENP